MNPLNNEPVIVQTIVTLVTAVFGTWFAARGLDGNAIAGAVGAAAMLAITTVTAIRTRGKVTPTPTPPPPPIGTTK